MSDIALQIYTNNERSKIDLSVLNGDLALDEGLRTAALISLFTDKRANDQDVFNGQGKRGWWADAISEIENDRWGSKLWLLEREKERSVVLSRAVEYAKDALKWMIEDEIAETIDVEASFPKKGFLRLDVSIIKPKSKPINFAFDTEWNTEGMR